ncbi:MAG: hypothetical protein WDW38_005116 [Sanguina aurantia]
MTLDTLPAALHSQPVMAPPRRPVSPTFAPPSQPATPASPPHVLMVALDGTCSLAPNTLYTLPSVTSLTGPGSVDLRYFTSRWALPSGGTLNVSNAEFERCLLDDPTNGTFGMPLTLSLASPLTHVTLSNVVLATKAKVFGTYLAYVGEGACPPSANVTTDRHTWVHVAFWNVNTLLTLRNVTIVMSQLPEGNDTSGQPHYAVLAYSWSDIVLALTTRQLAGPGGGIAITSNVTFVTVTSRAIMLDLNLQTNVLLIKSGATVHLEGMSLKNLAKADASATRTAPGGATSLAFVFPLWLFNFDRSTTAPTVLSLSDCSLYVGPNELNFLTYWGILFHSPSPDVYATADWLRDDFLTFEVSVHAQASLLIQELHTTATDLNGCSILDSGTLLLPNTEVLMIPGAVPPFVAVVENTTDLVAAIQVRTSRANDRATGAVQEIRPSSSAATAFLVLAEPQGAFKKPALFLPTRRRPPRTTPCANTWPSCCHPAEATSPWGHVLATHHAGHRAAMSLNGDPDNPASLDFSGQSMVVSINPPAQLSLMSLVLTGLGPCRNSSTSQSSDYGSVSFPVWALDFDRSKTLVLLDEVNITVPLEEMAWLIKQAAGRQYFFVQISVNMPAVEFRQFNVTSNGSVSVDEILGAGIHAMRLGFVSGPSYRGWIPPPTGGTSSALIHQASALAIVITVPIATAGLLALVAFLFLRRTRALALAHAKPHAPPTPPTNHLPTPTQPPRASSEGRRRSPSEVASPGTPDEREGSVKSGNISCSLEDPQPVCTSARLPVANSGDGDSPGGVSHRTAPTDAAPPGTPGHVHGSRRVGSARLPARHQQQQDPGAQGGGGSGGGGAPEVRLTIDEPSPGEQPASMHRLPTLAAGMASFAHQHPPHAQQQQQQQTQQQQQQQQTQQPHSQTQQQQQQQQSSSPQNTSSLSQGAALSQIVTELSDQIHLQRSQAVRRTLMLSGRGQGQEPVRLEGMLGEGTFGRVYKATWRGTSVAVKSMVLPASLGGAERRQQMAIMETAISTCLSHPNIVQTYTYMVQPVKLSASTPAGRDTSALTKAASVPGGSSSGTGDPAAQSMTDGIHSWEVMLVLELCDRGSLRTVLDQGLVRSSRAGADALAASMLAGMKGSIVIPKLGATSTAAKMPWLDYGSVLLTALDIARAMAHLHAEGILHGDLKASNVLLKSGGSSEEDSRGFTAKVADFGLSMRMDPHKTHMSNVFHGTLTHLPPEVLVDGKVSRASDVYAFGIVLWELLTCQRAFQGIPRALLGHEIIRLNRRPVFPPTCPPAYRDLACLCWDHDPHARPTFEEAILTLDQLWRRETETEVAVSTAGDVAAAAGYAQ